MRSEPPPARGMTQFTGCLNEMAADWASNNNQYAMG